MLAKVADADGPWQGLSPRGWRAQIQRLVIQVDADAARRRREEAIRDRAVRAWPQGDGTGVLQIIGQDSDIAFADAVLTNLALAGPATGPDGETLSMDQRRVDGFMDLMRRVAFGDQLPQAQAPRDREVGIVVHADTLFGDGPAKHAPGELRGLGAPAPIDPHSAAELARGEIAAGAATRVLLVDRDGVLQRTIRLPRRRRVAGPRPSSPPPSAPPSRTCPLETESYEPTVAITEHVRAVHPRCTSYDCARLASPLRPGPRRVLAPRTHQRHQPVSTLPAPPRAQDPRPRANTPAPRRIPHHHNTARHDGHHPPRTHARLRSRARPTPP